MTNASPSQNAPSPYERFASPLREPISLFATRLREIVSDSPSLGWHLYGPVTRGVVVPGQRIQSVLVLDTFDLDTLRRLAATGSQFHREQFTPPVTMTPETIRTSRDSFPLELIEIQQRHVTMLGDDVFASLDFDARDVRLQCERELKTMAMAMRQTLLMSGGDEATLARWHRNIGDGLLRVLRGMLWVKGKKAFIESAQVMMEIEAVASRPLPGVREAIEHESRRGWAMLQRLYADLDTLGKLSDAW
jgi:hypothetical protein